MIMRLTESYYKCTGGDVKGLANNLKNKIGHDFQIRGGILYFTASEDQDTLNDVTEIADRYGASVVLESTNGSEIIRYVPLFEEFSAGRDKHLVIVDVQKEFEQWMKPGFIQKVHDYAKNIPNVYQVWDANRAQKPSETFQNQKALVPKRYGYDLRSDDIRNHFDKPVQDQLMSDFESRKFVGEDGRRKAYETRDGNLLTFVGKSHQFFMAERELRGLLEYFKSLKDGVTLCGGADGECLADVEALMDHYGVPYEVNREYVYKS
jgi:hypothetical protein